MTFTQPNLILQAFALALMSVVRRGVIFCLLTLVFAWGLAELAGRDITMKDTLSISVLVLAFMWFSIGLIQSTAARNRVIKARQSLSEVSDTGYYAFTSYTALVLNPRLGHLYVSFYNHIVHTVDLSDVVAIRQGESDFAALQHAIMDTCAPADGQQGLVLTMNDEVLPEILLPMSPQECNHWQRAIEQAMKGNLLPVNAYVAVAA